MNLSFIRDNPIMLLVVGIPVVAVLVGITLVVISFRTFDGVVVDDYYKHGKGINKVLGRDSVARNLSLTAKLIINGKELNVILDPGGQLAEKDSSAEYATPATDGTERKLLPLNLSILHPTLRGLDQSIPLQRIAPNHYSGTIVEIKPGDWIFQIETSIWRLSKRTEVGGPVNITLGESS